MPTRKRRPGVTCTLLDDTDACEPPQVAAELEVVTGAYEHVVVSGAAGRQHKVVVALAAEHCAARSVDVEVVLVPGYPFVAPRVRLRLAPGVALGDAGAITSEELSQLQRDIRDSIQPCLAAGVPCIMQMLALVSAVVERDRGCDDGGGGGGDGACATRSAAELTVHASGMSVGAAAAVCRGAKGSRGTSPSHHAAHATATPRDGEDDDKGGDVARGPLHRGAAVATATTTAAATTASLLPPSPSLTPVPLKAQDAMRLTLLTLHLLRKCCYMKDMESREEAESNFEWLASHLLREVSVFPRAALRLSLPWRGGVFARAFAKEMRAALAPAQGGEHADLLRWFWSHDEHALKPQQGSEGRYRGEFIEQRLLGSGGFAPVYVCRKKIDGRLYAIKKIVMDVAQSDRVLREVQTLAALHHKNIVRYYDAWVEDGCEAELRRFIDTDASGSNDASDGDKSEDESSSSSSSASDVTSDEDDEDDESDSDAGHVRDGGAAEGSDDDDSDGASSSSDSGTASVAVARRAGAVATPRRYRTLYIQMELCSARSLRHVIDDSDRDGSAGLFASSRGEKAALSILRQLLTVIAHTHREQIVHRDLKPENVLFEMRGGGGGGGVSARNAREPAVAGGVDDDDDVGIIRVVDFGLARVMSDMHRVSSMAALDAAVAATTTAAAASEAVATQPPPPRQQQPTGNCGSVLYSAPEQANGLDYDVRVDEFSIGMIALEMWLAVAGKGFRDRYTIMTEVWRGGALPAWFVRWNTPMAHVIAALLERDARRRRTCEDILASATLPGDPPEFAEALDTVERYSDHLAGRVLQRLQRVSVPYRKPPPAMCAVAQLCASGACTALCHAIHIVALLHGCTPVSAYETLVPMNEGLARLGVDSVLDLAGRCFVHAALPHYAVASFLGVQAAHEGSGGGSGGSGGGGGGGVAAAAAAAAASLGSFYQFYCKQRPYAVFTSPLRRADEVNESALEPLLCLLHILSLMQSSNSSSSSSNNTAIDLVFSHVDWLSAVAVMLRDNDDDAAASTGTMRGATFDACAWRVCVEQPEQVGPALSRIGDALATHAGVALSHERNALLHSYVTLVLYALTCFEKTLLGRVHVYLDPALQPSSSLVDAAALDVGGLLVECRLRDEAKDGGNGSHGGNRTNGSSSSSSNSSRVSALAFGCLLDNFITKCTVVHRRASAFCVVLDVQQCAAACRHVRVPVAEPLLLSGVALRRHDLYAQTHLTDVVAAAVRLWLGNIRACVRCDSDLHSLAEVLKGKQLRWLLLDGCHMTAVSTGLQGKAAVAAASSYSGGIGGGGGNSGGVSNSSSVTGGGSGGGGGGAGSGKLTLLSLNNLCSDVRQLSEATRLAERRAADARAQVVFVANAVTTTTAAGSGNGNNNNSNTSNTSASSRHECAIAQQAETMYTAMLQAAPSGVVLVVDATMSQIAQCMSELSGSAGGSGSSGSIGSKACAGNHGDGGTAGATAVAALAQWLRSNVKLSASMLPIYSTVDKSIVCYMTSRPPVHLNRRTKDKNMRKHR